jgi:hypothetical protein
MKTYTVNETPEFIEFSARDSDHPRTATYLIFKGWHTGGPDELHAADLGIHVDATSEQRASDYGLPGCRHAAPGFAGCLYSGFQNESFLASYVHPDGGKWLVLERLGNYLDNVNAPL